MAFWPLPEELSSVTDGDSSNEAAQRWTVQLIGRPDRPDLVGLHIFDTAAQGKARPTFDRALILDATRKTIPAEKTYWLDPARNDAPVELDSVFLRPRRTEKTKFLEYATTPDGRCYPTHWIAFNDVGTDVDRSDHFRLTVETDQPLEPTWFGDPAAHFTSETGEPPPPDAIQRATHMVVTAVATAKTSFWWWWPWAAAVIVFAIAAILIILQRVR
jgi:hypothetical protein